MNKPVILIVGEDGYTQEGSPNYVIRWAYTQAVRKAGGIPVVGLNPLKAAEYADQTSALLLTGGPLIHPGKYHSIFREFSELKGYSQSRDELDFALTDAFIRAGKPVFGIGRGAAVINVYFGGDIRPNTDAGRPAANIVEAHSEPGSFTEKIYGPTSLQNQFYSYRIGSLGKGLSAAASGRDKSILAVENRSKRIYGTLWHPEKQIGDSADGDSLFEFYVQEAES